MRCYSDGLESDASVGIYEQDRTSLGIKFKKELEVQTERSSDSIFEKPRECDLCFGIRRARYATQKPGGRAHTGHYNQVAKTRTLSREAR
jgi:hypothetical protein